MSLIITIALGIVLGVVLIPVVLAILGSWKFWSFLGGGILLIAAILTVHALFSLGRPGWIALALLVGAAHTGRWLHKRLTSALAAPAEPSALTTPRLHAPPADGEPQATRKRNR